MADLPSWSDVWASIVELRPEVLRDCDLTPNDDGWVAIHCPMHQDENPSLRVNVERGGIKCMAGCDVGKNINDLEDLILGMDTRAKRPKDAVGDLAERRMLPRDWLIETFGVEEARAGYSFPVDDPETDPDIEIDYEIDGLREGKRREHVLWKRGAWINAKITSLPKYRWEPPLGESGTKAAHLIYNLERIRDKLPKEKLVYICAGPPDVWVMQRAKFPAISFVAGEGGLPSSRAISKLKGADIREVIIIYDQDEAGRDGAQKLAVELGQSGIDATGLILPEDLGEGGDLTDLWVRCGGDADAFAEALATQTEKKVWRADDVIDRKVRASRKRPKKTIPELPEECFVSPFDVYYEAVEPSTSACREYHFFALMNVLGAIFGRRAYIKYGRLLYPNQYTVLVGKTHSYKSTANSKALEILESLYGHDVPDAQKLNGTRLSVQEATGSAEGLLEAAVFADADPEDEAAIRGMLGWSQKDKIQEDKQGRTVTLSEDDLYLQTERRLLVHQDEFAKMLSKARQGGGGSGFIPHLLTAFDCPKEIRLRTRAKPLLLVYPVISILSDSTEEQLGKYFDDLEWSTGFGNRIVFVKGPDGPSKALPPGINEDAWKETVALIREAYHRATNGALDPQHETGVEFVLIPKAVDKWTELYEVWMEDRQEGWTEEQLAATERTADYAMKFALLYALTADNSDERVVTHEDVDLGWKVALHAQSITEDMVSHLIAEKLARWTEKIKDFIDTNEPVKRRVLQQQFRSIPATVLWQLLGSLIELKVVEDAGDGYRIHTE